MKRLILLSLFIATLSCLCHSSNPFSPVVHRQQGRIVWQLFKDKDYTGPVLRASVDQDGKTAYLATLRILYRVKNDECKPFALPPQSNVRLSLAPGGGVYAWQIPIPGDTGLFFVRLMDITGAQLAELKTNVAPFGFSALILGFKGNLIVTAAPLGEREGLGGPFRYTFWRKDGLVLRNITFPQRQACIPSPSGDSIIFLGPNGARGFLPSGQELWHLRHHFRKGAIAKAGKIALLNPAPRGDIDKVFFFEEGHSPETKKLRTPVHNVITTPDGSQAVTIGNNGSYFKRNNTTGEWEEMPSLPFTGTYQITCAEFLDSNILVLGVLHREGEPPNHEWSKGSVIAVDLDGNVLFLEEFSIENATACTPCINAEFGSNYFTAFTEETTIEVDMDENGR